MATKRPPADAAALEQRNAKIRADFLRVYEGSTIKVPTTLRNRQVIRVHKRTFAVIMRNWFAATTLARAQLTEKVIASRIEAQMLAKIGEIRMALQKRLDQARLVVDQAGIDLTLIHNESVFTEDVVLLGPVTAKYRELLLLADEVLDVLMAVYTFGEISEAEYQSASYDIRNKLQSVEGTVRKYRVMVMQKVNDEGKARPGYEGDTKALDEASALVDGAQTVVHAEQEGGSASAPEVGPEAADRSRELPEAEQTLAA